MVFEASKATNDRLLTLLDWTLLVTKDAFVLDLGSGHDGISHEVVQRFGCKVIGANISPEQNSMNLKEAEKLGAGELVNVTQGVWKDCISILMCRATGNRLILGCHYQRYALLHAFSHFQSIRRLLVQYLAVCVSDEHLLTWNVIFVGLPVKLTRIIFCNLEMVDNRAPSWSYSILWEHTI
jgi:hypothetical protein